MNQYYAVLNFSNVFYFYEYFYISHQQALNTHFVHITTCLLIYNMYKVTISMLSER